MVRCWRRVERLLNGLSYWSAGHFLDKASRKTVPEHSSLYTISERTAPYRAVKTWLPQGNSYNLQDGVSKIVVISPTGLNAA